MNLKMNFFVAAKGGCSHEVKVILWALQWHSMAFLLRWVATRSMAANWPWGKMLKEHCTAPCYWRTRAWWGILCRILQYLKCQFCMRWWFCNRAVYDHLRLLAEYIFVKTGVRCHYWSHWRRSHGECVIKSSAWIIPSSKSSKQLCYSYRLG